jgi:Asp-tRNA(Asn)/Glu-tRNA(Gln) amidotransferase A subunit family amidase
MTGDTQAFAPAPELLALLQKGEVSSVDLAEMYLRRIERHNPAPNAVITVDAARARREAANVAGSPATTIPVDLTESGLPVGIPAMGPAGGDLTTIEFTALLGEQLAGCQRPPAFD